MAKRKIRYVPIRGTKWKLILGRPPLNTCEGVCDYNTSTLWIRPDKDRLRFARSRRLDHVSDRHIIVHEVLHAALPDIEEEAIDETADAINDALDAWGV